MRISDWSSDLCSSDLLILHVVIPNCDLRIKVKRSGIAVKPLVSRISARGWQFCCDSAIINVNAPNFSPLCQRLWASSGVPMEPYKHGRAQCRERVGTYG